MFTFESDEMTALWPNDSITFTFYLKFSNSIQGVSKKMRRSVCLISPVTSSLHSWDIFQMKGDIHSFVLSTSSLLYDIGEPRYKQNKTGYQILRIRYLSIFDNLEYLQSYWWSLKTKIGQIHKEHSNNIHWRLNFLPQQDKLFQLEKTEGQSEQWRKTSDQSLWKTYGKLMESGVFRKKYL